MSDKSVYVWVVTHRKSGSVHDAVLGVRLSYGAARGLALERMGAWELAHGGRYTLVGPENLGRTEYKLVKYGEKTHRVVVERWAAK